MKTQDRLLEWLEGDATLHPDDIVVMVGGAPLNEDFAKAIGADAYCRDAAVTVETAKEFMMRKHNQQLVLAASVDNAYFRN